MRRVALVLCGGKSSRMGRAKACLPWLGHTMIEHVVETLHPVVDEVLVVTSKDLSLPPLDARIVEDFDFALGPLAGIRDGLRAAKADRAFVTSTDAPFLSPSYVAAMFERGAAVAPRAEGHVQVLSAIYPGTAWREAERLLENGQRRPLRLLEDLDFERVDARELVHEDPAPWQGFNTPEEYLFWARATQPDSPVQVELLGRIALGLDRRRFEVPMGTLGDVLNEVLASPSLGKPVRLIEDGQVVKTQLVSLGGRDLVRNLDLPVGPGERVSVIDALAGG